MQVTWYLQEEGDSFLRQKLYGKALRRYYDIHNIYQDHCQEQLDFHFWCLRKATLRQYRELIVLEDKMFGGKIYRSAISQMIQAYIELHDLKAKEAAELETLKPEEKQQRLDEKEKQKKLNAEKPKGRKEDPDGVLLEEKGLDEAWKFVQVMQKHSANLSITHNLAFEVAFRQNKYEQALKAVVAARGIDAESLEAHYNTIRLFAQAPAIREAGAYSATFEKEEASILGGLSLGDFNKKFLEKHQTVRGRLFFHKSEKALGHQVANELLLELPATGALLSDSMEVYLYLLETLADAENSQKYKEAARALFPMAVLFKEKAKEEVTAPTMSELLAAGDRPENIQNHSNNDPSTNTTTATSTAADAEKTGDAQ